MIGAYRIFGIASLLLTLFFVAAAGDQHPRGLIYLGFPYAVLLIFREQCARLVDRMPRPLLLYGLSVFIGGLVLEYFAYRTGVFLTAHGQKAFLFYPDSLVLDLFLFGAPHYAFLACGLAWTVRRYEFSVFKLGLAIFLFWAMAGDAGSHFVGLFNGGIAGVLGFIQAGFLMLPVFHGPYVLFEKKMGEAFPARSPSIKKYLVLALIQGAAILLVFLLGATVSVLKSH